MISDSNVEDLTCCCHDSQESFLGQTIDQLGPDPVQRQLLLHSFREVTVQVPLTEGIRDRVLTKPFSQKMAAVIGVHRDILASDGAPRPAAIELRGF